MGVAKRRRPGTESSLNSTTPARKKPSSSRGRGRPPNAPRDGRERPPSLAECFKHRCSDVLDRLSKKDHYDIFLEPVKGVAGYHDIIKRPMDLSTVRSKLTSAEYKSLGEFRKDLDLIWSNCLLFNGKEPTNVFSKKAIELRRLTDKLIVTTRQQLEKDKEAMHKWKEKYRKRRETMAANAALHNARLHGTSAPYASPASIRQSRDYSDPMASADFTSEHHTGKSPEEHALAEALRLQYAGTTGLYRKGSLNAPMPQYTKPDGSIAHIPIVCYNPVQDYWAPNDPVEAHTCRRDSIPELLCDTLPPSRLSNPCKPDPRTDFVFVSDYAESLYHFVRGSGSIAADIVTEILSPELVLRAQHELLRKKGMTPKQIATAIKAIESVRSSLPLYTPLKLWNRQAIVELADDIERVNKRAVSILPKTHRTINEYNGIQGLRKFLDDDLIKEVESTPSQIIDFSMPHGVSLATLHDIVSLTQVDPMAVAPNQAKAIEMLRKQAQTHLSRLRPDTAAKIARNPAQQPNALFEFQRRTIALRKQREHEADKHAALIVEQMRKVALPPKDPPRPDRNEASGAMKISRPNAVSQQLQTDSSSVHDVSLQQNGQLGLLRQNQPTTTAFPANALVRPAVSFALRGQSIDTKITCTNCGTVNTPRWQSSDITAPRGLCVTCGLFWEKTRQMRPKDFATQTSFFQSMQKAVPTQNGRTILNKSQSQLHTMIPGMSPNGVSKPPIQKKTTPSASRRSPSSSGSGRGSRSRIPSCVLLDQSMHPAVPNANPNFLHGMSRAFPSMQSQSHLTQTQRPSVGGSVLDVITARAGNQRSFNIGQQLHGAGPATFVGAKTGTAVGHLNESSNANNAMNVPLFSRPSVVNTVGSQPLGIIPNGSESFMTAAKQTLPQQQQNPLHQALRPPQQGFSNVGASAFNPITFQGNNAHTMFNSGNINYQNANVSNQGFIPEGGMGVQFPKVPDPNSQVLLGQRTTDLCTSNSGMPGAESMSVNGGTTGDGLGNASFAGFANQQGNAGISHVSSVGDMRGSQLANISGNETPAQMMENLLFGMGGIASSPSGAPEFEF